MSRHRDFGRPDSEQLTDLAVYVVPPELWREHLHSAISGIDAVSAGFLRIHPETVVASLREEIDSQLTEEYEIPQSYVFLKNIGKCLTKVRTKQENVLKVKNFVAPGPSSFVPEIYLLESGPDTMSIYPSSVSSTREDPYTLQSYRGKNIFNNQKPIPPIQTGGEEYPTNHSIEQGKHPLTNSTDTVCSNNSQAFKNLSHTNSTSSMNSVRSLYSNHSNRKSKPLPGIMHNSSSKAVSFPEESNDLIERDSHFHRTPTPKPFDHTDSSDNPNDKAVQFGFDDKAIQAPGSFILSNENNNNLNTTTVKYDPFTSNTRHADNTGKQNGYRSKTPPPLSATPPIPLSPVPVTQERETPPLPPLSATPPITSSGANDEDTKQNGHQPNDSSRWEARDSPRNGQRPNTAERKRQAEEEERRRIDNLERQRRIEEDRRRKEDERRKMEDDERKRREDEMRREAENKRKREEAHRDEEERRKEMEEMRRRNEEERRRQLMEEEDRRREEEERQRLMEEERDRNNQFRRKDLNPGENEEEKQTMLEELRKLREERQETEKRREELVKRAKLLQNKTQNRRNQARDVWKKKYFDEKKKTPPLEDQCSKLRQELDSIHRRIVTSMEGSKDKDTKRLPPDKPSPQSNVKIQAARLQHEIEDLQRRVETIKMKLTAEMKLRNQAEVELRALRAELTQKKINVTLARSKQQEQPDIFTARSQPPALSSRT